MKKTFLHVGCGQKSKNQTTTGFAGPEWNELRLDVDSAVNPDVVGSILEMTAIESNSIDAIYSSHNIEHLYPHEVPVALEEFKRVLRPDGFVVVTCPDLDSVCAAVVEGGLTKALYSSPAGPIAPIDILFGHRVSLQRGNLYMAHRSGFTESVLSATFQAAGFGSTATVRRKHPHYDLWLIACMKEQTQDSLAALVRLHFPSMSKIRS